MRGGDGRRVKGTDLFGIGSGMNGLHQAAWMLVHDSIGYA